MFDGEEGMNYQRYMSGVERRRRMLRNQLEQANRLRREAHLPQRNVDQTVTEAEPLMTQQEFDARAKQQAKFSRFRQQQMAKVKLAARPGSEADWQQHRALVLRQAFLEHQVKKAWQDHKLTNPS